MRKNIKFNLSLIVLSFLGCLSLFYYLISNKFLTSEIKQNLLNKKIYFSKKFIKSCNVPKIDLIPNKSIAVIGHAYGSPATRNEFISEKINSFLDKNISKLNLIIFTGDVFKNPSKEKWNKLFKMYGEKVEIIIAPGNHDVGFDNTKLREEFNYSDFNKINFPYSIVRNKLNIIIEDSTSTNWIIGKNTYQLIDYKDKVKENMIIRHHIPVKDLLFLANSKDGYEKNLPSLNNLAKLIKEKTVILAGDTGAFKHLPRLLCTEKNNVKIIVNGIGDIKGDKILIINEDKIYSYRLN